MPVIYGTSSIIPGPLVTITKDFVRSADGKIRRRLFNLVVKGKLVAFAGSPSSAGVWYTGSANTPPPNEVIPASGRLASLKNKQAALIKAFSQDGLVFQIQPWDGSSPITCVPTIKSVEFAEGIWTDTVPFTIQMQTDNIVWGTVDGGGGLTNLEPEETWSVEILNENLRSYRISHTVSSQQLTTYDGTGNIIAEGWENAKTVVLPFVGAFAPAGILPPQIDSTFVPCNYVRSQQTDYANGRYSVTENFVYLPNVRYTEEFVVDAHYQEGRTRVNVQGTVTGYAVADPTFNLAEWQLSRYTNALTAWADIVEPNIFNRAQSYTGIVFNPLVLNNSVGFNPINGVVTYNFEYDDRPSTLFPGAITEILSVSGQNPADVFAEICIPNRVLGPIIQSIGTVTAPTITASIELVVPPWSYGSDIPVIPVVTAILLVYYPAGGLVAKDDYTWSPQKGRYTRSITWTY